jgi:uncharacterized protein YegL
MKHVIPIATAALLVAFAAPRSIAQDNVVIVLDDSGSMNEQMRNGGTRMEAAKSAIAAVLKQFKRDTKLGVLLLNGSPSKEHWVIPLEPLSVETSTRLVKALRADGGTPLGDRIREGADALLKMREKQIFGNYRLLIVTDGEANDARLLAAYLPDVLSRGIIVDAIGVDMKQDHSLATRVHSYRRADDQAALQKAVQEVFAERDDSASGNNADDFSLLEAIDSGTAKEVINLLSKPNNTAIVGVSKPVNWSKVVETGDSFSWSILIGMLTCIVPLLLFVIVIGKVLSKLSGK